MAQRGRKSAASLSIVSMVGNERPAPPDDLTEAEMDEWRSIAGRMPVDWFTRENFPLLCEYCRHIVRARDLAGDIAGFKKLPLAVRQELSGVKAYDMLLKMADRERAAIVNLATKMRLTQQSRYRGEKSIKVQKAALKPWEMAG